MKFVKGGLMLKTFTIWCFTLIFVVSLGCSKKNNPASPNANPQSTPSWQLVGNTTFSTFNYIPVSLEVNNGIPYLAYQDGYGKAVVVDYANNAWATLGNSELPTNTGYAPQLFFSNGTPYVTLDDATVGPWYSLLGFNGGSWVTVGNPNFYVSPVPGNDTYSFVMNNNTPYVVIQDASQSYKATLYQFNGSSWSVLGGAGFSPVTINSVSLAFSGSTPYVAFSDFNNAFRPSVMSYNGSSWSYVGTPDFISSAATPIVAAYGGYPYVAFADGGYGGKASVMFYNGLVWVYLGTPGFTSGPAGALSFYIYNGTPYIAYSDGSNSNIVTVMAFLNQTWQKIGTPPAFTATTGVDSTSLFVYNGTPYVAYHNHQSATASVLVYQ